MQRDEFEALDPALQQFLRDAVEQGRVWALEDDEGWALSESTESADRPVLPLWSDESGAAAAASGEWDIYRVTALSLDELLEDWLPGLHKDDMLVGVNWDQALEGIEIPPLELQADLEAVILEADAAGLWDDEESEEGGAS